MDIPPAELQLPMPASWQSAWLEQVTDGSPEHCRHQHGKRRAGIVGKPQNTSPDFSSSLCPVDCVIAIFRPVPETFLPSSGKQSRLSAPPSGPGNVALKPLTSHLSPSFGPFTHVPSRT